MEPAVTVGIIAGIPSTIAAFLGALTAKKTNKVDGMQVLYESMAEHMKTITAENEDLRRRQASTEQTLSDVRVKQAECEADKARQDLVIADLSRRLDIATAGS